MHARRCSREMTVYMHACESINNWEWERYILRRGKLLDGRKKKMGPRREIIGLWAGGVGRHNRCWCWCQRLLARWFIRFGCENTLREWNFYWQVSIGNTFRRRNEFRRIQLAINRHFLLQNRYIGVKGKRGGRIAARCQLHRTSRIWKALRCNNTHESAFHKGMHTTGEEKTKWTRSAAETKREISLFIYFFFIFVAKNTRANFKCASKYRQSMMKIQRICGGDRMRMCARAHEKNQYAFLFRCKIVRNENVGWKIRAIATLYG